MPKVIRNLSIWFKKFGFKGTADDDDDDGTFEEEEEEWMEEVLIDEKVQYENEENIDELINEDYSNLVI